jgi:hypothetical protein
MMDDIDFEKSATELASSQPPQDSQNLKFEREDWTSFRTVEGLQQKAGVAKDKLRRLVLKELADNGLDEGGKVHIGELSGGGYFVEDEGRGISALVITGDAPEIVRAVQLIEIDENLNRRELSPALRRSLSKQRALRGGAPGNETGLSWREGKGRQGAKSQNATEQTPAFIDARPRGCRREGERGKDPA